MGNTRAEADFLDFVARAEVEWFWRVLVSPDAIGKSTTAVVVG